jgi:CheY-like chemotaxis protein
MKIRAFVFVSLFVSLAASSFLQAQSKRPVAIDDIYRTQQVGNPQCSPDGKWIAYTVTIVDREADKRRTSIWMVNWEGTRSVQLTSGLEGDSSPRWSPDGKYLSFLSARPAGAKKQVWLLDRLGGEARQLTSVKEDISSYAWAPDGTRMVLEMSVSDEEAKPSTSSASSAPGNAGKIAKPIVIDRYHFKQDVEGYITSASRTHLYVFDVKTKKLEALTSDKNFEDSDPVWSPDGTRIAYVSNHEKEPDQSGNDDIFLIEARAGATPTKLASAYSSGRQHLAWSPDGKLIAYLVGTEPKYDAYKQSSLAVVPAAGAGTARMLTERFDRILLAEDNLVNQRLAVRMLEKRGHRVTIAANGREALEALEKNNFDLVIMDVQMPEMDGLEAVAGIRRKEMTTGGHQMGVALTAHAMKGDQERCLSAGMDGYLTKPIRPQELDEILALYGGLSTSPAFSQDESRG